MVVLANAPTFRFSFRGNMRTYPRSGFSFRENIRMYLRSGFRSGGTSTKTTLLENHPFVNPRISAQGKNWPRGSTGVQRYGCIPRSAANNFGEIPKKIGSPKPPAPKSLWVERTFWDSSLLVSLTLWDTLVRFTPPLPLPPTNRERGNRALIIVFCFSQDHF